MKNYVIEIRNETREESPVKAVTGGGNGLGGETNAGASKGEAYAVKMAKRLVSVGAIVHTVDQVLSHQHSVISLQTGAQEYGQRASFAYQKTSSFIKAVGMGALAGSAVSPLGAVAGGVIAGLTNIGAQAMNYLFAQDVIQKQKSLEDISRRMNMTRVTVSGRRYSNVTEF